MNIFPAIDLRDKKVVRLFKGDYDKMTVYADNPLVIAKEFEEKGSEFLHVVDLDGAKDGNNPNLECVEKIVKNTALKVEIGGGIRNEEIIKKYIDIGVFRVILGTIAVKDFDFLKRMVEKYGDKIAVGVDIADGYVAIHGWTEKSGEKYDDFFKKLEEINVKTVICTDISKDGAMSGTNLELYKELREKYQIDIIASGGVSSYKDIEELTKMDIYGAILGKALYTKDIELEKALEIAGGKK